MTDFNQLIATHQPQVKELLRQYGVIGQPNENTIAQAYNQHGAAFITKLIDILNNPEQMNKTPFKIPRWDNYQDENGNEVPGPELPPGWTPPTTNPTGRGWTFFENFLKGAGMLGDTYAGIRANLTGQLPADQLELLAQQEQAKAQQSKSIMYIAGGVLVVILIVLVLKTRKD